MAARRFVSPAPGDDLAAIADRELVGADAAQQLLSWNLHLAARPGGPSSLLPSDVVFVEPPAAR